ncbi:MAG TPA: N-methyl-L-tryptophan oxidase [Tepidisphaeraceae bacterium]|jgi:sarcosine oxidase|nr:N-methyl-L-tryptophan oxidase [Tepidisphaeraceae bacterium]
MNTFDVIVIGIGAMGSSACHHLARRGARVLGLEQFDIPHALGSSHGSSRMIRLAYYEHPDYVPLLRRAYELWDELEGVSGQKLLYRTGGLYMGPPDGEIVGGAIRSAREHGLAHEVHDRDQIRRKFPQFEIPEHWVGLFEPEAGFLAPERVIAAYAQVALRAGAEVRGRETVIEWTSDSRGVRVRTNKGEYHAAHLVFCGGPWSGKLVRDLGVTLTVTRQVLGWVWPRDPDAFALGKLPVWAIDHLDGTIHYGFPMIDDVPGFKLAHHRPGPATDPDRVERDARPGDEDTFRPILRTMIPSADGTLLSMKVCLYTNTPDGHFILDRHPAHDNVTIACGFSGHGFKFASVIGEILADLAIDGSTKLPVSFLAMRRFGPAARGESS